MRLRDLDGRFVYEATKSGKRISYQDAVAGMQGVMFQCPLCGAGLARGAEDGRRFIVGAHYILALFSNPIGVSEAPPDAHLRNDGTPNPHWQIVSGSTIDDLTLAPSIDCNIPWKDEHGAEHPSSCKFHGFVRNGEAS